MSLYQELPTDVLVRFYYEIQKNIDRGILSNAMFYELILIKQEAKRRHIIPIG